MKETNENLIYDLNIFIVNDGMGSKILALGKELGISGGTILYGRGTLRSPFLKFFELDKSSKEIVLIISNRSLADCFLKEAYKKFKFHKANNGICFSISICDIIGMQSTVGQVIDLEKCGEGSMNLYNSIFVIVDRGNGEKVVDVANEAGARGATIINARGSGIHEKAKIFAIEIEPEKEIVLILIEEELTDKVCTSIRDNLEIDKAGKGVMFVNKVSKAYGLNKN